MEPLNTENVKWQQIVENTKTYYINTDLPFDSAILSMYSKQLKTKKNFLKEVKTGTQTDICTQILKEALFTITKW